MASATANVFGRFIRHLSVDEGGQVDRVETVALRILGGRYAFMLTEDVAEVRGIGETTAVGHLFHGDRGIVRQQSLGHIEAAVHDEG